MTLQSRLWAISLIAFAAAATLTADAAQAQAARPHHSNSNTLSQRSALQPGIKRVTFQSAGETLVGNLYLPASYKPGKKLPTVIVTGAWMTIKGRCLFSQETSSRM